MQMCQPCWFCWRSCSSTVSGFFTHRLRTASRDMPSLLPICDMLHPYFNTKSSTILSLLAVASSAFWGNRLCRFSNSINLVYLKSNRLAHSVTVTSYRLKKYRAYSWAFLFRALRGMPDVTPCVTVF